MKKFVQGLAVSSLIFALGCGGGGGGSGEATTRGEGAKTGVRVLHGSIEGPPVQVLTSLESRTVSPQTFFAQAVVHDRLSSGEQTLIVTERFSPSTVFGSHPVSVTDGSRFSLLLFNMPDSGTIRSLLVEDSKLEFGDEEGALRVAHAATRAQSVVVTVLQPSLGISIENEIQFGRIGEYITLPTGTYQVVVKRGIDSLPLINQTVVLGDKSAKTLLVAGEVGFFVTANEYQD
jgi:hypothetical protein